MGKPRRTKFPKKKQQFPRDYPDDLSGRVRYEFDDKEGPEVQRYDEFVLQAAIKSLSTNPDVVHIREEARRLLGDEAAGPTLKGFISMNTKRFPLDPWAEPQVPHTTGSEDPLTYDVVVPIVHLNPGSEQPHLVLVEPNLFSPVYHGISVMMRGVWTYMGLLPEPGLKEREWVVALTGRFTAPYSRQEGGEFEQGSSTGPNWPAPARMG